MATTQESKPVSYRIDKWQQLNQFAKETSQELGVELSLPDATIYAITKLKELRKNGGRK